ncbi:hypothetical protein ACTA71_008473 [Dictyostelium dimigraforme]
MEIFSNPPKPTNNISQFHSIFFSIPNKDFEGKDQILNDVNNYSFNENFIKEFDDNGETALTFFIRELGKFKSNLKFFIDPKYQYLLNIPNDYGQTPLHVAVITNNKTFTKVLVKANANAGIKDNRGLTPIDIAIMFDYQDIIKILENCETSKKSDIKSNIYYWGEIITSDISIIPESKPIKFLFNDELSLPISVEYGQNFSLILTDTGTVYSSGFCSYGKTGQKKKRDTSIPIQIKSLENICIRSISCGSHHSLALDDLGSVYSWGNGSNGRLGLGEKKIVLAPTLIPTIFPVVQISAGLDNSFFISSKGGVYSFGSGIEGKLGYEVPLLGYESLPTRIESIPPMKQVSASHLHTVLLDMDGNVYTFGSIKDGRLARYSHYGSSMIDLKGAIIKKIATGTNFTIVLSEKGELFGWGGNSNGQLGFEPGLGKSFFIPRRIDCLLELCGRQVTIQDYAVGDQHVVVLTDDGRVFCFGDNKKGQCGTGLSYPTYSEISLTKVQSNGFHGNNILKVFAGSNNTMVSLTPDCHEFGEELLKFLNSNLFSDINLKVNGFDQPIKAHKIVLAARSKKLDSLIRLQLKNPSQSQSIKYKDNNIIDTKSITSEIIDGIINISFPTSFQSLYLLLNYLYSDKVYLIPPIVDELGELSHSLGISKLSNLCKFNLPLQQTLLKDLKEIQNQEYIDIYSDVQFNCISNSDPSENGIIKSYKLFSYLGSSCFKSMLGGPYMESGQNEITLKETSVNGLRSLLKFCYSEEIPDDINECIELIIISNIHSMDRAKDITAIKIRPLINSESVCFIYHISKLYNVTSLSKWCLAKLNSIPTENLNKLPYFNQLPDELKIKISNKNK